VALKQFYLVKRKDRLTNGKPTYYARLRVESGELKAWRSTAETSKTRAENWALAQLSEKEEDERLTLARFGKDWFTLDHPFVKGRGVRRSVRIILKLNCFICGSTSFLPSAKNSYQKLHPRKSSGGCFRSKAPRVPIDISRVSR
jgi:hypothetical protein